MKLAIAGVGNNASALVQGVEFYRGAGGVERPGIGRPLLGGIHVCDVEFVAAFDASDRKVGLPLHAAIFAPPNNYPDIGVAPSTSKAVVSSGICNPADAAEVRHVARVLSESDAEVLLYSLPTGLPDIARAYAKAAIEAGVAFVNCTPDLVAGDPELLALAEERGVPLVGDDLQSHLGSSVVHGALLALYERRGVTLAGSYQMNVGGNADFDNLRRNGQGKERSKHNALRQKVDHTEKVKVVPSAAYLPYLGDRKVAHISVEGRGWANMPVRVEVKLEVQDSSNAAGVIIDLVRIAAAARRRRQGGFPVEATSLLKSAPIVGDAREQTAHAGVILASLEAEV